MVITQRFGWVPVGTSLGLEGRETKEEGQYESKYSGRDRAAAVVHNLTGWFWPMEIKFAQYVLPI